MSSSKPFHGRAIYQPGGAAGEYAKWACNIFNGCSNRCDYCYNRHSQSAKTIGKDEVTMKKQLLNVPRPKDEQVVGLDGNLVNPMRWPFEVIMREILTHRQAILRDGGLFLSFASDPLLPQTYNYTLYVLASMTKGSKKSYFKDLRTDIPVTILTKSAWWLNDYIVNGIDLSPQVRSVLIAERHHLSLGFTLTGMDYMERHCISNTQQRIDAMVWAKQNGIHTWASIEPVIDFDRAFEVIYKSFPFCDEYRIGLASKLGIKYDPKEVANFVDRVRIMNWNEQKKIIWKKSIIDKIKKSL